VPIGDLLREDRVMGDFVPVDLIFDISRAKRLDRRGREAGNEI
jgi:hypothetical protein